MSALAAVPRARSVNPMLYAPLDGFTCGTTTSFEREVNEIVQALYDGAALGVHVRVAEDNGTGEFLGVCGIVQRPLLLAPPHGPIPDAAYIAVIAVPLSCRGKHRLPDGTRLGEFLLKDALRLIHLAWGGGSMPPVWALIDGSNAPSHNIFNPYDFGYIPPGPAGGYDIRLRPRGLPPP